MSTCIIKRFDSSVSCDECAFTDMCPDECKKICTEMRCGEDEHCRDCKLIIEY